ncbi:thioesterase family protein [Alkalibacter mobilis]|uniref:thioesterase family protein n=1 Tax=Alkalibacter mobilis TaxID=2787712 RepID=UPI00189E98CE|nr:thioesterase family protein [Alkalibacter mobilis]MBF7096915.1 thioesterase family protein [Alkalibacter mobilis]
MDMEQLIGKETIANIEVGFNDTAKAMKSGGLDVLATPKMVALMENAAYDLVQSHLDQGKTTVGTGLTIKHLSPTPMRMTVKATAKLVEAQGKKLVFKVEAWDEIEKIGEGTHERYIVDMERFIDKCNSKIKGI